MDRADQSPAILLCHNAVVRQDQVTETREGVEARREGTASPCSWRRAALSPLRARFVTSPCPRRPHRAGIKGGVFPLAVFLAACGGGGGAPHVVPPPDRAQISTFAYVMNECEAAPGRKQGPFHQALWIREGDRDPVKVAEFSLQSFPRDLCLKYGQNRAGVAAVLTGAFQRLGVTPDGSTVVFEVTDDFSLFRGFVPQDQKGFFAVRADGSGLHRIADPSREPSFAADWNCILVGGTNCTPFNSWTYVDFSPESRQFVFTDRGPDTSGTQGPQISTLDLATGERTQLTFLPPLPLCREPVDPHAECVPVGQLPVQWPRFLDAQTVAFQRRVRASAILPYTVDIQTKELKPVQVVAIAGGGFVPIFQITTGEPIGFTVFLPDLVPVNGPGQWGNIVTEAFNFNGRETLQLTAFGRSDTAATRTTLDGSRVLFVASADPLGTNPTHTVEYFSIDPLGGDLQQLTHLGPNCRSGAGNVDRGTGTLVFDSSCDPFGTNPYGDQAFAMRPDGTGLRQLTSARGLREGADGALAVELPGPWAVAARYR